MPLADSTAMSTSPNPPTEARLNHSRGDLRLTCENWRVHFCSRVVASLVDYPLSRTKARPSVKHDWCRTCCSWSPFRDSDIISDQCCRRCTLADTKTIAMCSRTDHEGNQIWGPTGAFPRYLAGPLSLHLFVIGTSTYVVTLGECCGSLWGVTFPLTVLWPISV